MCICCALARHGSTAAELCVPVAQQLSSSRSSAASSDRGEHGQARAVANRTDACFIRVIGSELVQKYVGEGARMVRELFQMARSKKACLIFFDEVDAIGGARHDDGAGELVLRVPQPGLMADDACSHTHTHGLSLTCALRYCCSCCPSCAAL